MSTNILRLLERKGIKILDTEHLRLTTAQKYEAWDHYEIPETIGGKEG